MKTVVVRVNGDKLRKLREAKGLTTTQVAAAIDMSERTYQRIEKDGDPRLSELAAALRTMGMGIDRIPEFLVAK